MAETETQILFLPSQQELESASEAGARVMTFYQLVQNPRIRKSILPWCSWRLYVLALLTYGCGGAAPVMPPPIVQPPSITAQPTNQIVVLGQTATFTAAANGTPPLNFQWNKDGTAISGATSTSYTTLPTVQGDDGSTFTMTVTNAINSATSMPAMLKVLPATPPQAGDLRFQQVDAPSTINGYGGGLHTNIGGGLSETFFNAVGTPLTLGDDCGPAGSGPYSCAWFFDVSGLPANLSGPNVGYVSSNGFANLDSDVSNIDTGHAVITSVDLHPEDDTYAISYMEAVQSTGFTLTQGTTVAPSNLQAVATQEGALSHVITAVSFNAGNVTYFSYAWQSDPSTVYEAQVVTATFATLSAAATNLGQAGYIITALGGNGTDGFVLVGTRVKGNTAPRPVLIGTAGSPQSQQIFSQGYAVVGYIFQSSGGVSATTFIGEK